MLVENLLEYRKSDQLSNDSNISFTSEIRNNVEIMLEVESKEGGKAYSWRCVWQDVTITGINRYVILRAEFWNSRKHWFMIWYDMI
jgi:hypothetical protein